ncbi:zeta toxin family protein [Halioxenophilus aromaticivorans]|uniref:Zeta toxin family protein n=1 Tax=Halioxenophilus aromaticivorans TaxID=1306992 RepID=A0AAV3TXN9_9ALTE
MKQLWLLAGGNGAGKSTFYRTQLEPLGLPFVNADLIAKEYFPEAPESFSYDAAKIAEEIRNQLLLDGRSFCFETVFSHPSKIDFLGRAKAMEFEIILVFVHLQSSQLNKARVSQRVVEGGHFVPDDKVDQRIPRTLVNVHQAAALCDQVMLFDNSYVDEPFQLKARLEQQQVTYLEHPVDDWVRQVLGDFL